MSRPYKGDDAATELSVLRELCATQEFNLDTQVALREHLEDDVAEKDAIIRELRYEVTRLRAWTTQARQLSYDLRTALIETLPQTPGLPPAATEMLHSCAQLATKLHRETVSL